jgi:hypothetical protein
MIASTERFDAVLFLTASLVGKLLISLQNARVVL